MMTDVVTVDSESIDVVVRIVLGVRVRLIQ